jgi:hypothetical protein
MVKKKENRRKFLPQQLMYELLYNLNIRIGGIPDSGYFFHLIPNLKEELLKAGYSTSLVERIKNLDFYGEDHLRDLLSDIDKLHKFVKG